MDATFASFQARLATFTAAATTKTRRTSNRSKKAVAKPKAAWPLQAPAPEDLAFAGFVWKPTTASTDNVQCFSCNCQLDGWEESDVPAYEHLTHSPHCAFAIVTCIRLRNGDPGRTEDDPISARMAAVRHYTFGRSWPLDPAKGFPPVEAMVAAGWVYDPTEGNPDGVTCPYCALSLDAWDAGDNPYDEHKRRSPDCLFFTLCDLYHPPAPKKSKRASTKAKGNTKRSSTTAKNTKKTRTSTASLAKKPTRGTKRSSEVIEEPQVHEEPKRSSKRLRVSNVSISSFPSDLPVGTPKKTPTAEKISFEMSSLPSDILAGTPRREPSKLKETLGAHTWQPTDVDAFFSSQLEANHFINDVLVESGLDDIIANGVDAADLHKVVLSRLTNQEKEMTIEQWVLYNAQRGAEKLRSICEKQIAAFEAEGRRALGLLESLPVY